MKRLAVVVGLSVMANVVALVMATATGLDYATVLAGCAVGIAASANAEQFR